MINIVVPMAGQGSRFFGADEGDSPKPLILVASGKTMIDYVIGYLTLPEPHRFIFVCRNSHNSEVNYETFFSGKTRDHKIIVTQDVTEGPAASALLAASFIDNDDELLIAYCDMFLTTDVTFCLSCYRTRGADGGVVTYPSKNPMDSYAQIDADGLVTRTAEKDIISGTATAGLYYFRRGKDYVAAARNMLADWRTGDAELFVNPAYNELIRNGKTVYAYPVAYEEKIEMGTPDDLQRARLWFAERNFSTAATMGCLNEPAMELGKVAATVLLPSGQL